MKSFLLTVLLSFFLQSCATTSSWKKKAEEAKELTPMEGRVWVYKQDGSRSCRSRKGKSSEYFANLLRKKGVTVYKHRKSHDGKMRILVCGASTGNIVELLVDGKDLPIAGREKYKLKKDLE